MKPLILISYQLNEGISWILTKQLLHQQIAEILAAAIKNTDEKKKTSKKTTAKKTIEKSTQK